jgi:hypothetical protein
MSRKWQRIAEIRKEKNTQYFNDCFENYFKARKAYKAKMPNLFRSLGYSRENVTIIMEQLTKYYEIGIIKENYLYKQSINYFFNSCIMVPINP